MDKHGYEVMAILDYATRGGTLDLNDEAAALHGVLFGAVELMTAGKRRELLARFKGRLLDDTCSMSDLVTPEFKQSAISQIDEHLSEK